MKEINTLRMEIPVVIVGGGLSGLALSREYSQRGIEHVVFEANPHGKNQSIHYLTSKKAADSLGLSARYQEALQRREPITGYTIFDGSKNGLVPLLSLSPRRGVRDGFVTFSIAQIRDWVTSEGLPVQRGQPVKEVNTENDTLVVRTAKGDEYLTRVVIDATGARAKMLQLAHEVPPQLITNRFVRYCYGGVFPYSGPEDQLLFVNKFPHLKDMPPEGAGWIMPLGNNKAEVVVGWEGTLKDRTKWHTTKLPQLLSSYIEWYTNRGIEIDPSGRTEVISGIYSEGLLDYRRLPLTPSIVAFGESTGLNNPINGYLIDRIAGHAQVMGEETERYLSTGNWDPYKRLIGESPINYGLANSHLRRKIKATREGTRISANKRLKDMLVTTLGEDGFWSVADNGVPLGKLLLGVTKHPQYLGELAKIGTLYAGELIKNNHLYLSELGLKLKTYFRRKK